MKIIGLTGSIGCGKSSVSNILISKGIKVIDADKIAREIFNFDNVKNQIVDTFGQYVLNFDGEIDRKKLGQIVFNCSEKLLQLNKITHPVIIEEIKKHINIYLQKHIQFIVLDAPLLIEVGMLDLVDIVLLITCDVNIQVERVKMRDDLSDEEVVKRINAAMSSEDKKHFADYVIDNSDTTDELLKKVEDFINCLEGKYFE